MKIDLKLKRMECLRHRAQKVTKVLKNRMLRRPRNAKPHEKPALKIDWALRALIEDCRYEAFYLPEWIDYCHEAAMQMEAERQEDPVYGEPELGQVEELILFMAQDLVERTRASHLRLTPLAEVQGEFAYSEFNSVVCNSDEETCVMGLRAAGMHITDRP